MDRLFDAVERIATAYERSADCSEKMIELHERGVKAQEDLAASTALNEQLLTQLGMTKQ